MKHVVDADAGDMVTVSIFYIQPMHAQCAVQNQDVLDEQPKKPQQLWCYHVNMYPPPSPPALKGGEKKKEGSKPGAGTVYLMKCLISVNILIV